MGELRIGVNTLMPDWFFNLGTGHAFVQASFGELDLQIHGAPVGGAFPGGAMASIFDNTMINVEQRSPEGQPYNTVLLASDIPDDVLRGLYTDVLRDAQTHFSSAQYEPPQAVTGFRFGIPTQELLQRMGLTVNVGGRPINLVDLPHVMEGEVSPYVPFVGFDGGPDGIQNSNTVARWVATQFIVRLRELG